MEYYGVFGVVIVIIEDGDFVYVEGFGVLQVGGDEVVNVYIVFFVGLVSKIVIFVLMLCLYEFEQLDINVLVFIQLVSW